jgi:Tfp pilus assembly protein PilN
LLVIAIGGVGLIFWTIAEQNTIRITENEIRSIEQQIAQNRPIYKEINSLREDKERIQQKIRALERINVNREKWVRLMEELSGRLPELTWLVSVREENSSPPVLHLEGRTYSFVEVANYMSKLKESEYVASVDLSNIEQIDPKENVFRFAISCAINPDAKLSQLDPDIANGAKQ